MREARLVRKWACTMCGKDVIVNTENGNRVLTCGCGSVPFTANYASLQQFKVVVMEAKK